MIRLPGPDAVKPVIRGAWARKTNAEFYRFLCEELCCLTPARYGVVRTFQVLNSEDSMPAAKKALLAKKAAAPVKKAAAKIRRACNGYP